MSGGAWPFIVGGMLCLVDSDNERDLLLLLGDALLEPLFRGWCLVPGKLGAGCCSTGLGRRRYDPPRLFPLLAGAADLLRETMCIQRREAQGENRSVMPFDVLGCTRFTMSGAMGSAESSALPREGWEIL